AGTGTPALAVGLVGYLLQLELTNVTYHGQKTHTKKIYEFADRIDKTTFTEDQFKKLLRAMSGLSPPVRLHQRFLDHARRKYPNNPYFPYFEAVHMMGDEPEEAGASWRVDPLLNMAAELARKLPPDPELQALLDDVHRRQQMLRALNPFMNLFSS